MNEDNDTPPTILLKLMGGQEIGLQRSKRDALRRIGPNAVEWFDLAGDEAWAPLAMYVHMSGCTDASEIEKALYTSAEQTIAAIGADVDGIGMEIFPPGNPGEWSRHWTFLPAGHLGDEDFVCMAVDWSIALLVSTSRIVGPENWEQLDSMRHDAVEALLEDAGEEDGDFDDLVTSAVVGLLRKGGIRMTRIDQERIDILVDHFGTATNPDEIAEAWMAHSFVHRNMHAEIERRYVDAGTVMMLAEILFTIDLKATSGPDGATKHRGPLAIHAVHDAIRTMLMDDVHDVDEAHVFSDTLGGRAAQDLCLLIEGEEPSTIALVDALTRRAFVRRAMQTTGTVPYVVDEPHLLHKARAILRIELQDMIEADQLPSGVVEWMIALAVSTIGNSQEQKDPHDPVWRTIARRLSDDDEDRSNPDHLSIEGMEALRTGVGAIRGSMTIDGVVVHCVDPDLDDETSEAIHRLIPEAGTVVPGDVQMTRIAKVAHRSCPLREAMNLVERVREECGVHGAHLVGTLDGRSCLIDVSDANGTSVHVGTAKRTWN